MTQFLQQLINGISLGSIYALIALGYTMVYGIIKLINFAHGDIYMLGAYIGFVCITYLGLGFVPSLIISMILCAVLGILIEKLAYKPLRNAARIAVLITAIGVSLFLEYGTMAIVGPTIRTFPQVFPQSRFEIIDGVVINVTQIYILLVTIVLMILLQYIVRMTRMGKAMRAVSTDQDAARLMGINVDRTISFTFAIGSALAGAAGILVGIYYNSIDPLMGMIPGIKAFVAAVLGGIGIIPGAMLGGISIGVIETFVSGYGSSLYKDAAAYAILILVLIVKPSGLLGKNVREKV
ncbi:branched-chain amino acid ABC transporter permease [Clostridium thermosuccinogenes]|uniref:Branched-chain amino acid ABC transporter permease n=1 Tax=Clostridium thermosuccinogenes TaxID=84032 RepID=A0A2K2FFA0_9CLOT|nr:branched-chain amino acid ABC transporter permease [Pseudoclostridium thermosuccinogenes]AUS97601.1 branched-chain amino acid ABC transporter permease [Pseudoclostridium thermosuccinogenes]PNT93854.1 branched-chain amino acid ABC transporter permease [Pseudoclostridium thermosuccinogenes]PNT97465.1 branched-chain amino acid ABC transporter permease [Pseudoclostridium thermosuccinogenes]PNT99497.1 branched-chain amino acid ABC transporter permease [Pseudoclostridium thermosuccinogenes]